MADALPYISSHISSQPLQHLKIKKNYPHLYKLKKKEKREKNYQKATKDTSKDKSHLHIDKKKKNKKAIKQYQKASTEHLNHSFNTLHFNCYTIVTSKDKRTLPSPLTPRQNEKKKEKTITIIKHRFNTKELQYSVIAQ